VRRLNPGNLESHLPAQKLLIPLMQKLLVPLRRKVLLPQTALKTTSEEVSQAAYIRIFVHPHRSPVFYGADIPPARPTQPNDQAEVITPLSGRVGTRSLLTSSAWLALPSLTRSPPFRFPQLRRSSPAASVSWHGLLGRRSGRLRLSPPNRQQHRRCRRYSVAAK
jgi:hypothetical protein